MYPSIIVYYLSIDVCVCVCAFLLNFKGPLCEKTGRPSMKTPPQTLLGWMKGGRATERERESGPHPWCEDMN